MTRDQRDAAAALATLVMIWAFGLAVLAAIAGIWLHEDRCYWTAIVLGGVALFMAALAARLRGDW